MWHRGTATGAAGCSLPLQPWHLWLRSLSKWLNLLLRITIFTLFCNSCAVSCCYFLHYSCQLGAFTPYSNYYHYHLYAAPLKTWFSSLSASSPPPPPSSSSVYYMIQLESHQIKGHGCNQSFESIHLSSLFLLTFQLWLFADRPLLLWKFERIKFRRAEIKACGIIGS